MARAAQPRQVSSGVQLYERAQRRIPGGTQLLSKRPEMFLPGGWPAYAQKAEGVYIWDLDGTRFLDMSYGGIGACILGYADRDVDGAVIAAVRSGSMSTLSCPEEVALADLLCELHPWASMVRFARGGGEAMAVAVRIARAATGRDAIAFCGYHGWHDWYLAANLSADDALDGHLLPGLLPAGVPRGLMGTVAPFAFNDLEDLTRIVAVNRGALGAIVLEPVRSSEPTPAFVAGVRRIADECGAVLIVDEVTAGFRLGAGGAHLEYGLEPDVAVFAKALGNGYPIAAVIGRGTVMHAAEGSFISSTSWTERVGPSAALATLRKHAACSVPAKLDGIGRKVQQGWRDAAEGTGLDIDVSGVAPLAHFRFADEDAQARKTLFTQLLLDRGILATTAFYPMFAHTDEHVDRYLAAVADAFVEIARAAEQGTVCSSLRGPVAHAGFHRLT